MSKIGIIGAMELEVATLKKNMDTDQITKKAGMEFHEGNLKKDAGSSGTVRCRKSKCSNVRADSCRFI